MGVLLENPLIIPPPRMVLANLKMGMKTMKMWITLCNI